MRFRFFKNDFAPFQLSSFNYGFPSRFHRTFWCAYISHWVGPGIRGSSPDDLNQNNLVPLILIAWFHVFAARLDACIVKSDGRTIEVFDEMRDVIEDEWNGDDWDRPEAYDQPPRVTCKLLPLTYGRGRSLVIERSSMPERRHVVGAAPHG